MFKQHPISDLRVWKHEDVKLMMPNSEPLEQAKAVTGAYVMHYDGGCSHKKGSGGFLVWDPKGKCIGG